MNEPLEKDSEPADDRDHSKPTKSGKKPFLSPVLRFVVTFLVTLGVLGVLYALVTAKYHDKLTWIMELTATISGFMLSLFTGNGSWAGKMCSYQTFTVEIIDECTGLLEMVIYSAAVVSFATTIRKKLLGLALGIPVIYAFNIIRIIFLLVIGSYSMKVFDFMHLYFWQATLIIMISAVWIGWLYLVVYREKRSLAVSD